VKRFFRDTGILLAFCGAFYLLIVLVGRLDGDSGSDSSEFSPVRKRADKYVAKKDWGSAIKEYEKLIEQDPYNGHAWYRLGSLLLRTRTDAMFELSSLEEEGAGTRAANDASKRIENSSARAYEVLSELTRFARYRRDALIQLAILECDRGEHDAALDYLEEFIGRGYSTRRGLDTLIALGEGSENEVWIATRVPSNVRLHQHRRFWGLVRRERRAYAEFRASAPQALHEVRFEPGSWGRTFLTTQFNQR